MDPLKVALIGIQVDQLYSHAGGELVLPGGDAIAFAFEWANTTAEAANLTQWHLDNDIPARAIGLKLLEQEQVEDKG